MPWRVSRSFRPRPWAAGQDIRLPRPCLSRSVSRASREEPSTGVAWKAPRPGPSPWSRSSGTPGTPRKAARCWSSATDTGNFTAASLPARLPRKTAPRCLPRPNSPESLHWPKASLKSFDWPKRSSAGIMSLVGPLQGGCVPLLDQLMPNGYPRGQQSRISISASPVSSSAEITQLWSCLLLPGPSSTWAVDKPASCTLG
mmetsp:Transcript_10689/g.32991  ORF Transcript_10689/g.32991 Transcript_10689/m.32991 type:complete len:200 (+) Transcript_10689:87-686(+)